MSDGSIFRVYWVCSHTPAAMPKLQAGSADKSLVLLNPEANNPGNAVQTKYIKDLDDIEPPPRAKHGCVRTMRLPCIFTAKSIMFHKVPELPLAQQMEFTPAEIGHNVHAHPTISGVLHEAAKAVSGEALHA